MAGRKTKIESIAKDIVETAQPEEVTTLRLGDVEAHVKRYITMRDTAEIVENVCAACFDDSGKYLPYVRDYMIDIYILRKYTDIDMPEDIEACLTIAYIMNSRRFGDTDGNYTWMDAIRYSAGLDYHIRDCVQSRINFELKKHEREAYDMVRQIYTAARALGVLLNDTIENIAAESDNVTETDGPGSIVADENEKVVPMPVINNED